MELNWDMAEVVEETTQASNELNWDMAEVVEEPKEQETVKDKGILDRLYEFAHGSEALRQKNLREGMTSQRELTYLDSTVDNPITATGNAILASGAGLNKIAEDITGLDLKADEAISKVKNVTDSLSSGTKMTGDILGATTLAPTSLAGASAQIGAQTLGEGGTYTDAAINSTLSYAGGKAAEAIFDKLSRVNSDGRLSREAEIMLNLDQNRMSVREAEDILEGIPKSEQAITLAERNILFKNYFNKAVESDSRLATALGKREEFKLDKITPFTQSEADLLDAGTTYRSMRDTIDANNKTVLPTDELTNGLDELADVYATDPSGLGTAVKQIKLDLQGSITPGTAIDIRENINAMLNKSSIKKSHKSKEMLTNIKSKVDGFINGSVTDVNDLNLMRKEIAKYSETINNYKFGKILNKNTKGDYATDWAKVVADLKDDGLHSKNIDTAIPILKEFETKFKNSKDLGSTILPSGSNPTHALGAMSKILGEVLDLLSPIFNRSRYKDIKITNAIKKSIRNTEDPALFVNELVKDKTLPRELVEPLTRKNEEIKQLIYKENMRQTGDVNTKPLYGTESGTVGDSMSTVTLKERQDALINKFIDSAIERESGYKAIGVTSSNSSSVDGQYDRMASKIHDMMESKRLNDITKGMANRLKSLDSNQRASEVAQTIETETNRFMNELKRETGMTLDKEEVSELLEMFIKDKIDI